MKQYQVTIAIPVYNVAPYVEASLLSALNQTFQSIEFIIVDDKGTDGSMDIVQRVIENHPRREDVRIIDQVYNQKTGAARNAGIDNATGEYIFFMDSDDVLTAGCIDILHRSMQSLAADFVAASFVRRDASGKEYPGCTYPEVVLEGDYSAFSYRYRQGNFVSVSMWNKLYRLSFLKENQIRCVPSQIHEDAWFTYQVLMKARLCKFLPDCTMYYTYNPGSSSGAFSSGYSENSARQFADIQKMKSDYIKPYANMCFYRGALSDIMQMSLYHAYQISISAKLDEGKKKGLEYELLSLKFAPPSTSVFCGFSVKYVAFRLFYMLPLPLRVWLLRAGGSLKVKSFVRRWIHF